MRHLERSYISYSEGLQEKEVSRIAVKLKVVESLLMTVSIPVHGYCTSVVSFTSHATIGKVSAVELRVFLLLTLS